MEGIEYEVRHWLFKTGTTKKDLARILGFTPETLNNKLSGRSDWTWSETVRLSEAIGVPLERLRELMPPRELEVDAE